MILLDSHILLWLLLQPELLSTRAAASIKAGIEAQLPLAVSVLTIYELARAIQRERVSPVIAHAEFLRRAQAYATILPVTPAIALTAAQLPSTFPSDPFDRIIAATAIAEGLPLVTADRNIRRSRAHRTIW
ncbi:MAG: type II toxin-antitoxin system VapC family toxin [Acidobacteriaceae bacterium]